MEVPPMPGSSSTTNEQETKEEESSMTQEPEHEQEINVALNKLFGNRHIDERGRSVMNELFQKSDKVYTRMVRISKLFNGEGKTGVLDSGATHSVRPKEPQDKELKKVTVELAGDMSTTMWMNESDTVMAASGSQLIVPLIPLVRDLQCKVNTDEKGILELIHPKKGRIPLNQSSGSPLMPQEVCRSLIGELEEFTNKRKGSEKDQKNRLIGIKQFMQAFIEEFCEPLPEEQEEENEVEEPSWWGIQEEEIFPEESEAVSEETEDSQETTEDEDSIEPMEDEAESEEESTKKFILQLVTDSWYGPNKKGDVYHLNKNGRKEKIHPDKEGCPVKLSDLQPKRITLKNMNEKKTREEDEWTTKEEQ